MFWFFSLSEEILVRNAYFQKKKKKKKNQKHLQKQSV